MVRNREHGTCHLCGSIDKLTFEHVPPRGAFNDKTAVRVKGEQAMFLGPDTRPRGEISQRGSGGYTLCRNCNTRTGNWYTRQFIDWCYAGVHSLERNGWKTPKLYCPSFYPLAVLKQIATMFFSVNPPEWRRAHEDLVRFVLNRESKQLPDDLRFFTYFNLRGKFRYVGTSVRGSLTGRDPIVLSEISFPPYGYVLTMKSEPPDKRLFEITSFADYEYEEEKTLTLSMKMLPTHMAFPGDYRSREEILEDRLRNEIASVNRRIRKEWEGD